MGAAPYGCAMVTMGGPASAGVGGAPYGCAMVSLPHACADTDTATTPNTSAARESRRPGSASATVAAGGRSAPQKGHVVCSVRTCRVHAGQRESAIRPWCQGSREALEAGADHYGVLGSAMQRVHAVARQRLQLMGASGRG